MKASNRWVVYKLVKNEKKQKYDKLPYNAKTAGKAQSNNSSTWCDYDTVMSVVAKYDGLGFMLGDGIFGVDIDGIELTDPIVNEIITTLGSYAEVSPSEKGVHIICKGTLPTGARRKGNIEMYDSGRFFTVTGEMISQYNQLVDCTESIKVLHEKYLGKEKKQFIQPTQVVQGDLSDIEIIQKIEGSKQADKFFQLYNLGHLSGDHSADDMSLCSILAFWTRCNASQIDSIFRTSALMRDKWDRRQSGTTYGAFTIQKAIDSCREVYDPIKKRDPKDDFKVGISNNDGEMKTYKLDDTGNAIVMSIMFGDKIRYAHDINKWFIYDGVKWYEDKTDSIRLLVNEMLLQMENDFSIIIDSIDEAEKDKKTIANAYNRHLKGSRSNKGKNAMLNETKPLLPILSTKFNKGRHLINTPSGTYDINKNQILDHKAGDYISQITKVNIIENMKSPRWEKFLDEIFLGDKELIRYIQKAVGYSLTGFTKEQCMFICLGEGQNGKGVFKDILSYIMNDYVRCPQAETISQIRQGNEASSDIVYLMDARMVICVESNKGVRFNEGFIKQCTGEDMITARRLYCEPISFYPKFKLWLFTNHIPEVTGTDKGIWRRLKLVPFNANITEDKKDTNLKTKLLEEIDGIFWWCIEGLKLYLSEGLKEPAAVTTLIQGFKEDSDTLQIFLNECTMPKEGCRVQAKDLYARYVEWCRHNNERPDTKTRFGIDIKKKLQGGNDGKYVCYYNIALIASAEQFVTGRW
jgi:putative DNA primase/helicase